MTGSGLRVLQVFTESFSAFAFGVPLAQWLAARDVRSTIVCSGRSYADAHSFVGPIRAAGVDLVEVPISREVDPVADADAVRRVSTVIRSGRYDLVHTHGSKGGLVGRLAAAVTGRPAVHTVYDLAFVDAEGFRRTTYLWAERLLGRLSRRSLFLTDHERGIALRAGVTTARASSVQGWGIRLAEFDPARVTHATRAAVRERLGAGPDTVLVGVVARLVRRKGIDVLVAAAARMRERAPDVRIAIVGGGPLRDDLERMARVSGVADRVAFAGFIDDQAEMAPTFAAFDVFCLPTRREGYGMVVAEAAAMGVPTIVSDIPPVNALVRSGETGLLVPVDDAGALADAIVALARDAGRRAAMGRAARRLALEECDLTARFAAVLAAYREVIADRVRRR